MFEKDYSIKGKHATYMKTLAAKDSGLYERNIDVYMNGAIFGLLFNRCVPRDTDSSDSTNILAEVFSNCRSECVFLYRLVMLLEKQTGLDDKKRVDRAFRDDADESRADQLKENLELFNGYVRGGIEVMYERFILGGNVKEEYLEKALDFMDDFYDEPSGAAIENKIAGLIS